MFNYNKNYLKRNKNGPEASGGSDITDKSNVIIDTSTLTTKELESRLASLAAGKEKVAGDTKEKLGDLYVKMLTESGMTFNNKEELHNFIIKLNSFGYEVKNNDSLTALFQYMPDFIQDNSSIRINGVLSKETRIITLGVDINPLDNDKLEIIKQHTVEEILMPDLSDNTSGKITDDMLKAEQEASQKEADTAIHKVKKEKKAPKMTEAEAKTEVLRKDRVNKLIKRYRKGDYKNDTEMNGLVKELYDKNINIARKTTPSEMDNFERAMDAVDHIVDKKLKEQQVVEVNPIDKAKQEEVVKKYSPEVQAVFDKLNSKKPYGPNNKMTLGHITIKTDNPVKINGKFKHVKLNQAQVDDYNKIVDQKNDLNTKRKEIEDAKPSLWDKLTSTEKKENLSEIKVATSEEFEEILLKLANKKPYGPNNKNTLGNKTEKSTFRVKVGDEYKSVRLSTENSIAVDGKKYSQLSLYNKVTNNKNSLNTKRKTEKQENNTSILDSITDLLSSNEKEKIIIASNGDFDQIMTKLNSKKPYGPNNKMILGHITEKSTFRVKTADGKYKSVKLDKDQVNVYNGLVDQKNKGRTNKTEGYTDPAEAAKVAAEKQAGSEGFSFGDLWDDLTSNEKGNKNKEQSEKESIAEEKLNKFINEITSSKTDNFGKTHDVSGEFKDFLKRKFSKLYLMDKPFSIVKKSRLSSVSEKIGKAHRKLNGLETHMYNELVNEGIRARLPKEKQKVGEDTDMDKNMDKALGA